MYFQKKTQSPKPLVFSFHGTDGTGKTYAADLIAKSLYKNGVNSKYVHKFVGRLHFPEANKASQYGVGEWLYCSCDIIIVVFFFFNLQTELKEKVTNAVSSCGQSLFIFDEVDDIPAGVLDSISSFFDHRSNVDGVDFRQSIFIFLTNTGGDKNNVNRTSSLQLFYVLENFRF
jgi:torsin-1